MIITIGGIKGGNGKSTIATNLVCWLHSQGKDVLLIDTDKQGTSTDFTTLRNEAIPDSYTAIQLYDKAVRNESQKLKDKYDFIVIDTGGRDTASQRYALTVSDLYLIPVVPRGFDLWSLEDVNELISEAKTINEGLRAFSFVIKADPANRPTANNESMDIIKDYEHIELVPYSIGSRKAFADSGENGLSIFEHRPKDAKAIEEITTIFKAIFNYAK